MKIKKIALGVSLPLLSLVALTSCTNGTKTVKYTDAEGNEKTVEIKKTENKEEVAEALSALVYSEGNNFKPYGFAVNASLDAKINGKQDNKNVNYGYSFKSASKMSIGSEYKAKDLKAYGEMKLNGEIPTDFFTAYANISSLSSSSSMPNIDYSKKEKLALSYKMYSDIEAEYVCIDTLNIPYEALGLTAYKSMIDEYVGAYYKLDFKSYYQYLISSISSSYGSYLPSGYTYNLEEELENYLTQYREMENPVGELYKSLFVHTDYSGQPVGTIDDSIKDYVEKLGLTISNVNGNNITFKLALDSNMLGSQYKDLNSNSYIAITIDALNKLPVGLDLDLSDIITYFVNRVDEYTKTAPIEAMGLDSCKLQFKASINIGFNPNVPTLDDNTKNSAKDITSKITSLLPSLTNLF